MHQGYNVNGKVDGVITQSIDCTTDHLSRQELCRCNHVCNLESMANDTFATKYKSLACCSTQQSTYRKLYRFKICAPP